MPFRNIVSERPRTACVPRLPRTGNAEFQAAAIRHVRPLIRAVAVSVLIMAIGCTRQDSVLQQHMEKLESLGATTKLIAEDWLAGEVSGTYARTALDQTFLLVEQERAKLVSKPEMLADARGAALSQDAERLSRLIASMIRDVGSADGEAARKRLTSLPLVPHEHP